MTRGSFCLRIKTGDRPLQHQGMVVGFVVGVAGSVVVGSSVLQVAAVGSSVASPVALVVVVAAG